MPTLQPAGQALHYLGSDVDTFGDSEDGVKLASQQRDKILQMLQEMHPKEMRLLALCETIIAERNNRASNEDEKYFESSTDPIEDYSRYPNAPEAIVAYLRAHGPTLRKKIAPELVRGGWGKYYRGKSREARMKDIRSAITYQLTRAVSPLIGLREEDSHLYVI